jgi:hypothetical protein
MLTPKRAAALAAQLELDVYGIGICLPCLTFVAFPLDAGKVHEARGATVQFTPILWEEGLALPARLALEKARTRGIPDADEAISDVDAAGARTTIARAIVQRLARDMNALARAGIYC